MDIDRADPETGHEMVCHWSERSAEERADHTTPDESARAVVEREVGGDAEGRPRPRTRRVK
jgi:hypothetical protein